jgi:hypothetical protein
MGGMGSGNTWRYDSKDTVESRYSIDVRRWKREGVLGAGCSFNWRWLRGDEQICTINVNVKEKYLVLDYKVKFPGSEEWEVIKEPIPIDRTPCNYGGERVWFICPLDGCRKRVAILYKGKKYFGCRSCCQLAYTSTRESEGDRLLRKAKKIKERLDWDNNLMRKGSRKPKGMWWKTYFQLLEKYDRYEYDSLLATALKLGIDMEKP